MIAKKDVEENGKPPFERKFKMDKSEPMISSRPITDDLQLRVL